MTARNLVSVVIPTYNRRHLIGETIASVLAQSYEAFELLVVDDGSSDGTREYVLDQFGSDSRLRYITQQNSERAVARNRGIHESQGQYIAFLDSDDLWYPHKLERQLARLSATSELACCYCLRDVVGEAHQDLPDTSPRLEGDIFASLLSDCIIGSMTPVVPRRCFEVVGRFCEDRDLLCFEDWEMWTRLASRFPWVLQPEVLASHRLHAGNTQHAASLELDELRFRLLRQYRLTNDQRGKVDHYIAGRRWHWAGTMYQTRPRSAAGVLMRIAACSPQRLIDRRFWGLLTRTIRSLAMQTLHATHK